MGFDRKAWRRAYYLTHREHELALAKVYAGNNKEKYKLGRQRNYQANKANVLEQTKAYAAAHPEQRRQIYRRYHAKNVYKERQSRSRYNLEHREERIAYVRAYRATEAGRLVAVAASQRRRARIREAQGTVSTEDVRRILSAEKCYLCRMRFTAKRPATLDHVIPLARGGKHEVANLAAAHLGCNSKKRARLENPITGQGVLI
jgi:5-methylcytosine-specific restriction endonuclease McrA